MRSRAQFRRDRFLRHIVGFVDQHRFPGWQPDAQATRLFHRLQSQGRRALTPAQLASIEPLVEAQVSKERTIQMLVEEMAEWQANHWGWAYPMLATLQGARRDRLFRLALLRIRRRIEREGFFPFLYAYPGTRQELKDRYLERWLDAPRPVG